MYVDMRIDMHPGNLELVKGEALTGLSLVCLSEAFCVMMGHHK